MEKSVKICKNKNMIMDFATVTDNVSSMIKIKKKI